MVKPIIHDVIFKKGEGGSVFKKEILQRILFLLSAMIYAHPGHPDKYLDVSVLLEECRLKAEFVTPQDDTLSEWLLSHEWRARAGDAGSFVGKGPLNGGIRP